MIVIMSRYFTIQIVLDLRNTYVREASAQLDRNTTARPPVLSPSSILLPHSSQCAFIPAGKNLACIVKFGVYCKNLACFVKFGLYCKNLACFVKIL